MTPPSPSTPSEGEIVESDSEKATTSLRSLNGTNVDRKSRIRVSVSRSPSPYRSPRRHLSRTPSRSPYREPRGIKRRRDEEHYSDRTWSRSHRFNSRHDDRSSGGRRALRDSYDDLDRSRELGLSMRYEEHANHDRTRDKTSRTRDRAPFRSKPGGLDQGRLRYSEKDTRANSYGWDSRSVKGYEEGSDRVLREQSVSDRGQIPVTAAPTRRDAENRFNQTQGDVNSKHDMKQPIAEYVLQAFLLLVADEKIGRNGPEFRSDSQESFRLTSIQPLDEATLIEERRKRREAIKAKHRGQSTPMLVQALALNKETPTLNQNSNSLTLAPGKFRAHLLIVHTDGYSKRLRRNYQQCSERILQAKTRLMRL